GISRLAVHAGRTPGTGQSEENIGLPASSLGSCLSALAKAKSQKPKALSLAWQWLLLRQAVQGSEPPHQIDRVNADNLMLRQQVRQRVERDAVVRIVERRHEDDAVRDVEVRVARWQAFAGHDHRARVGQFDDAEW